MYHFWNFRLNKLALALPCGVWRLGAGNARSNGPAHSSDSSSPITTKLPSTQGSEFTFRTDIFRESWYDEKIEVTGLTLDLGRKRYFCFSDCISSLAFPHSLSLFPLSDAARDWWLPSLSGSGRWFSLPPGHHSPPETSDWICVKHLSPVPPHLHLREPASGEAAPHWFRRQN